MKLESFVNTVDISNINKKNVNIAKIIPNAVMMDILGNKLYKNKIDSTVREIVSNAKDASTEAGVTTPIDIHVPTLLEPWFGVKDYGIGMDEETIVDVFANYGASTKRNSNALIGGFGIGAKVAGVYSGQFSVTSIKDGRKCIYQFFKDEDGMPANTCLYRGETNESNGTEIKIAANEAADFQEFLKCINKYCTWIDYKVTCNQQLSLLKPEFEFKEPHFGITKNPQDNSNNSQLTIIVGGIPYPIDVSQYKLANSIYENGDIKGIYNSYLVLFANIGDIDLIASREEVEYTPKTETFIRKVAKEIEDWYKTYLSGKTSFWLHQNTKQWERKNRPWFDYGFNIVHKDRNKWLRANKCKVYQNYISIKDLANSSIAYGVAAKKVNKDNYENTVAFIDKDDVEKLIKLGADKASIHEFEKLPKKPVAKKKKYTVLKSVERVDKWGRRTTKLAQVKTDDLEHQTSISVNYVDFAHRDKKDILEDVSKKVNVILDNSKPSELNDYMKKELGECETVTYSSVVDILESFGYISKLTKSKDDGKNCIRQIFGLNKRDNIDLNSDFPLLEYYNYRYTTNKKTKEHAKKYIESILEMDTSMITGNKHLKLLKT